MDQEYHQAVSNYNLRELRRALERYDDKCLGILFGIDIVQARLLKDIVNTAVSERLIE